MVNNEHEELVKNMGARGLLMALAVPEDKVYDTAAAVSKYHRQKFHDKPNRPRAIGRAERNFLTQHSIKNPRRHYFLPGDNPRGDILP